MRLSRKRPCSFWALVLTTLTLTPHPGWSAQVLEGREIIPMLQLDLGLDDLLYRLREASSPRAELQSSTADQSAALPELKNQIESLEQSKSRLAKPLAEKQLPFQVVTVPGFKEQSQKTGSHKDWKNEESLEITNLRFFQSNPQPRVFSLPLHTANYRLVIKNSLPVAANSGSFETTNQEPPLELNLKCSRPVLFNPYPGLRKQPGTDFRFKLWNSQNNGSKVTLAFPDPQTRCSLNFRVQGSRTNFQYAVHLAPESELYPSLQQMQTSVEACPLLNLADSAEAKTGSLFFGSQHSSLGCPHPTGDVQMLFDPYQAFNERMKSLTGSDIPRSVFDNQDLAYEIDFSNAPKMDLVLVSTLQFKSDFVGTMLARALKFHAQRGAMVRIMSTKILLGDKDEKLIQGLVEEGRGHIKYQPFAYNQQGPLSGDIIDRFQRTNHLKLVLGYSSATPEKSFVIVGGRNIRDSYYFRKIPDYSKNPQLIQYQDKEEVFIHYVDLEVQLRSQGLIRQVAMQFLSFLNRDKFSMRSERSSYGLPVLDAGTARNLFQTARSSNGMGRHFISVPYADGQELESVFVDMINSAKTRIRLISPYFAPRPEILEALGRAADRGVRVQVITRINLAGDDIPRIAEDVNKSAVNQNFRKIEIYEWTEPDSILHTKSLLIDHDLLYLGGTNLNNRSFVHDLEGGFIFTGNQVITDFENLYDSRFIKTSSRVSQARSIRFLNRILISIGKTYF